MIPGSKLDLKFFPRCFRRHVYLQDLSIVVMRDILQSRYLRRRVAHKQLARTSLINKVKKSNRLFLHPCDMLKFLCIPSCRQYQNKTSNILFQHLI